MTFVIPERAATPSTLPSAMLLKSAYSVEEMRSMVAQTPFGQGRIDVDGVGFQVWLKKWLDLEQNMTRLEAVEVCQRFEDKVVPFEMVRSATEDKVVLNEGLDDFNELPPFEETHFVRARRGGDRNTRGVLPDSYTPPMAWATRPGRRR